MSGVDWTKPIQTPGWRKELKGKSGDCMHVIITDSDGCDYPRNYWPNGRYFLDSKSENDIINIHEEKVIGVVNVYHETTGMCHATRAIADEQARTAEYKRTHVVTITRKGDEVTATVAKVSQ